MTRAEKLHKAAENQLRVYEAGRFEGYDEGISKGTADGYRAGYALLWDVAIMNAIDNSSVSRFDYLFSGERWNDETFKPPCDINVVGAARRLFENCAITDLAAILNRNGVKLDTSKATNLTGAFNACDNLTHVPEISLKSINNDVRAEALFAWCGELHTVDKVILSSRETFSYVSMFANCGKLVNVAFEGNFFNNISFAQSTKLSKDSIIGIMTALSQTTSGKEVIFSLNAVNKAFETSPGANDGSTSNDWDGLSTGFRTNWTVKLA